MKTKWMEFPDKITGMFTFDGKMFVVTPAEIFRVRPKNTPGGKKFVKRRVRNAEIREICACLGLGESGLPVGTGLY